MGLRLEVYNNNFVGLVADFTRLEDSKDFCSSNNIDDAMNYFDLYLDEQTNRLKRNDPNKQVVEKLAIDINNVENFQEQLVAITNVLTDEQALNYSLLFEEWNPQGHYNTNDRIRHQGVLYKCLQEHTAQEDWSPAVAVSLWSKLLINPEVEGPQEWVQPDSTNGYADGAQVIHNGIVYESQIDNNVWEPGVTGTEGLWVEVI